MIKDLDDMPGSGEFDWDIGFSNLLSDCAYAAFLYGVVIDLGNYDAVRKKLSVLEKEQHIYIYRIKHIGRASYAGLEIADECVTDERTAVTI